MPLACPVLPPRFVDPPADLNKEDEQTAVLFVNLGSPTRPTMMGIARYLREFLLDLRVVGLPRVFWWPLLHGVVLPLRSRRNLKKYQSIWMNDTVEPPTKPVALKTESGYPDFGSPLHVYSSRFLRAMVQQINIPKGRIALAMRYGQPAIRETLLRLTQQGAQTILLVPLYPQHASSTTGTALTAVYQAVEDFRVVPRIIPFGDAWSAFADAPCYINALVAQWRRAFAESGKPEVLLLSFHGLPLVMIEKGDPYLKHCQRTAKALTEAMAEDGVEVRVAYQSRFGAQKWLSPSSESTLKQLATAGKKHVAVACPGFAVDCLETLEEINIELREVFLAAGGQQYHYLPCLNDDALWVEGLAAAIHAQLSRLNG